ncbi:MAG: hypothetical protein B7X36_10620 [Thiomonas sp. 14-64-326]|nr:MAG: hypothetical protein B7X36_10620 [Thiomonas sp. 14-64-326]
MFSQVWHLLAAGDAATWHIVGVSLRVSGASVLLGLLLGLPLGAWLAVHAFTGRGVVVALLNSLLGLPSVIVGLLVYLLLSRSGPLGELGLLFSVVAALAGFGRAVSEVGAVMIAGGNIEGYTRTMTTAIALETSKGDLPLALALGAVLMTLVLGVNAAAALLRQYAAARYGEGA